MKIKPFSTFLKQSFFCFFAIRVAVEVVSTKTTADVMWKDGRVERGIRSNDLIPIQHLDSHEFCPGDFVVDKRRESTLLSAQLFVAFCIGGAQ